MHKVHLHDTTSRPIAVIRAQVAQRDLSRVVPAYCGEVWAFARDANLDSPGRHVAVYLDGAITLECGVEVAAPFASTERVVCSSTPAGLAATTTHIGGYGQLGEAHGAIRAWCAHHRLRLAGPSWEVYGHWVDPPAQPRTDIYYLVVPASG